ncbi:MAG: NAD(P)/FAD-dependent oxidoreductase [Lachnospiraceae bacterium]|nr:NAD(P)/FAD-dependent oxidoreductase [Candidatus Merdinaster equi]
MERYDIAIIGTGPAGLEAAITAKVRNKNVLLLGNASLSSKVEKAHMVSNYLGLPEVTGEQMQRSFLGHLDAMGVKITEDRVNTVYSMGDYFALQGHSNMYEASTVILACGLSVVNPFPGELENLGRGVSYCATCDAGIYKGKSTVVIGYSADEDKEVAFLSEMAAEVTYLPMYQGETTLGDIGNVTIISGAKPAKIDRVDKRIVLSLDSGLREIETDGLFILRENVPPSQLVPGLMIENNQVVVDRSMKTNIAGLFACGDITGTPYQYIKAAGEGNVAALSAVNYLAEMRTK